MTLARIRSFLIRRARALRAPSEDERGFGLVESIVSIGIAASGLLAVAGLLAAGASMQRNSRDGGRAGMAAMQQLEVLRMLPRTDARVQTGAGGAAAGSLTANVANYNGLVNVPPAGQVRVRWRVQAGPAGTLDITVRAEPLVAGARRFRSEEPAVAMTLSSERGMTMVELLVSSAVMLVVLGVTTTVMTKSSTMFTQQRAALDGRNSAAASVDLLTRLLRQSSCVSATAVYCQSIFPDADGNSVFDSVRVRADWNPRDGDLNDPYEDVLFVVANGTLWKREPADAVPVSFGDARRSRCASPTPTRTAAPLANPVGRPDLIGGVNVTIVTTAGRGLPSVTSSSSISLRRIK